MYRTRIWRGFDDLVDKTWFKSQRAPNIVPTSFVPIERYQKALKANLLRKNLNVSGHLTIEYPLPSFN